MLKQENFSTNEGSINLDCNGLGKLQSEFYSPLCKSGYLTPMQRKKLREKRCLDVSECREEVALRSFKKIKRCREQNVKKVEKVSVNSKRKQMNSKKSGNNVPGVKCVLAKIFPKTNSHSAKEKKFFKSSPSKRLLKANFTMPLVLKKNMFADFDKVAKELHSHTRKVSLLKETDSQNSSLQCINQNGDEIVASCEPENHGRPYVIKVAPLRSDSCDNSNLCRNELKNPSLVVSSANNENVLLYAAKEECSIFEFDWPSDEVFLKRQEKARSFQQQNILQEPNENKAVENCSSKVDESVSGVPVKLFPIFNNPKGELKMKENAKRIEKILPILYKNSSNGGEQMVIDAGQKEMGPKICRTCSMIYTIGHEEDERLHSDYHNMYLINLKFPGWKEENVVGNYCEGRVIMVRHNDKSWKLKKIEDIMMVANRDLGFPTAGFPTKPDVTFLLFISNEKRVAGCVVAEPITSASRVLLAEDKSQLNHLNDSKKKVWRIGNWYTSSESVPAVCGINRIWVSQEFRRRRVASRMVDCLRCHFVHGHVISIRELAFTDPSPDGREFATVYTGTENFLVYK